jgi:hypothetical protein
VTPEGRQLTQAAQPPIPNVILFVTVDELIEKVVIVRVDDDVIIIYLLKNDRFRRDPVLFSSLICWEDSISADGIRALLSIWRV